MLALPLSGCGVEGAPSFIFFGAYFPAWLILVAFAICAAIIFRAVFVATRLSAVLPFQLFVCSALGATCALVAWSAWFGK
ncbi:hypothetical protein [Telmatospirillum sp.]|uniref:hypothetical protein n=1 Tax=Telmatospirillum sp. TaxID=2079197 RepID=UPI00284746A7|nr:hypothetical protein [Telmatospirillum sp.]MDR3437335.1 hypothetical protein [Telmatospirillum sp.]